MELGGLLDGLQELYDVFYYGMGVAELGVAGVALLVSVIVAVVSAVFGFCVSLLVFLLEAIPLYKIANKVGRKKAWLVWLSWLPVIGQYLSTYVLSDIPGNKPLVLTEKVVIKDRLMSFWLHIGIGLFGSALITTLIGVLNLIPVLGQVAGALSAFLYLVPPIASAWIEYAYLRDVLNIFREDEHANRTAAIVVAVLDALVTFGLARAFYLYTVMNKEPLRK